MDYKGYIISLGEQIYSGMKLKGIWPISITSTSQNKTTCTIQLKYYPGDLVILSNYGDPEELIYKFVTDLIDDNENLTGILSATIDNGLISLD